MHRKMSDKLYVIFTFIAIAGVLLLFGCSGEKGKQEELTELSAAEEGTSKERESREEDTKEEASEREDVQEPAQEETVVVCIHVCGRVANPGVYTLPFGSRIYEALEAAGGPSEDAAAEQLNQALKLEDGQQIYVPSREEAEQGISGGSWKNSSPGAVFVNIFCVSILFLGSWGWEEEQGPNFYK